MQHKYTILHPQSPFLGISRYIFAHRMLLGFRLIPILRKNVIVRFWSMSWEDFAFGVHIGHEEKRIASPLEAWVNIFAENRQQSWTFLGTTVGTKKLTFRSSANFGAFDSGRVVLIPCEAFWRFGEPVWCSLKRVSQPSTLLLFDPLLSHCQRE